MSYKITPVCPACRAEYPEEAEPGTKLTCPECDERFRAEVPEVAGDSAKARAAARKAAPPKKKRKAKSPADLGKLMERFSPSTRWAMLITITSAAGVFGVIVAVVGLVGVGSDLRPFVLGGAGVLALVAVVCLLMLKFGGSNDFFEIRKKGMWFQTRKGAKYLFWDEVGGIDIQREIVEADLVLYEVHIYGSVTIHLTRAFMGTLDDPLSLISALKQYNSSRFGPDAG